MSEPIRIQRLRTAGFNLQETSKKANGKKCIYVGRGTRWGNPWKVGWSKETRHYEVSDGCGYLPHRYFSDHSSALRYALQCYTFWLVNRIISKPSFLEPLKGRNLACWCPVGIGHAGKCHADILLYWANRCDAFDAALLANPFFDSENKMEVLKE